jgi:hydroxymethylpyrimidine/phosphomethylpyrimidine kinase
MNRILTIAGSDSGGGAGIQADLKTMTLLGGFGMSVVTALTAQNTKGVSAIQAVPVAFVEAQLDAVLSDIGVDSAKTGMLFDAPIIEAVANKLSTYDIAKVVVDPVMVAKGGDVLLVEAAIETLVARLLPLALVVTPNIPEAEVLSKMSIGSDRDIREAARIVHKMGPKNVLIKGGHLKGPAKDTLFDGNGFTEFVKDRIDTPHTHGTGCTYSAAICTYLAAGLDMKDAVHKAKAFIHAAVRFAEPLGKGRGPTNFYAPFAREQEKFSVIEDLKAALSRLQESPAGHLVPEVQSNLGYALPYAETHADVAAFPGRLVRLQDKIVSVASPSFGASSHIATIILTAMRHDPGCRCVMNVRFSEDRVKQCQSLGWKVCAFDRSLEPKDIKEREGSTLEWGTQTVLSKETEIPDVIFDRGDVGKEPMIRVLGRTPDDVVTKVLQLQA